MSPVSFRCKICAAVFRASDCKTMPHILDGRYVYFCPGCSGSFGDAEKIAVCDVDQCHRAATSTWINYDVKRHTCAEHYAEGIK